MLVCVLLEERLVGKTKLTMVKQFSSLISEDLKGLKLNQWFKVFHTDKWDLDSASLKLFGNKEIKPF